MNIKKDSKDATNKVPALKPNETLKSVNKKSSTSFRLTKMIKKEFKLLKTDPINLFIALVLPPLIIVLFAVMMSMAPSSPQINCAVVTYDSNTYINPNNYTDTNWDSYSAPYLDSVNNSEYLNLVRFLNATEDVYAMETARDLLRTNQIQLIIVIPVEFTELLEYGYPGIIEVVPDTSDIKDIQNKLNAVHESLKLFAEENNLTPQFVFTEYQEFSIPANYDINFNHKITLTLSFIIFGISTVLTILVVVQEKPIARLLLTPVQKSEILMSKYITYTAILLLQVIIVLISTIMMGLYYVGSLFDLFIAMFIVGFTGIALGIFISTLSNTKTEANQMFFAFFIVIVLLSGIFIPINAMPPYLQAFAYILPLSHGDPMVRGIVTKGSSFLGFDFYCLLGLSVFLVVISFYIFRRKQYEV